MHLRPATSSRLAWLAFGIAAIAGAAAAQAPAPLADGSPAAARLRHGRDLLEHEDPVGAWDAYRAAVAQGADPVECAVGLGRTHLMLARSEFAIAYAEATLREAPGNQEAMALCVRGLIRARQFDEAVARANTFARRTGDAGADLLAARASALFRVQRIDEAATNYRRVVGLDPLHAEGHLRLGSGLLAPATIAIDDDLVLVVAALGQGDRRAAIERLQAVLARAPEHAIAHRLLGETLFAERAAASMAAGDPAFAALAAAVPVPDVRGLPVREFVPGY
ncbi:MAG: tetratricopeptide repeat protein, partial [Planctomycetota bacterium]